MKPSKVKNLDQVKVPMGNSAFYMMSDSFTKPNLIVDAQQLAAYQEALKWSFACEVENRLIKIISTFINEALDRSENLRDAVFSIDFLKFNIYDIISRVGFLEDTDWWFRNMMTLKTDDHGYLLPHPLIDMIATNICNEIMNRLFAALQFYMVTTEDLENIKISISHAFEDASDLVVGLFQSAITILETWGIAADEILDVSTEEPKEEQCHHCGCKHHHNHNHH